MAGGHADARAVEGRPDVAAADVRGGIMGTLGSRRADRARRTPMARLTIVADKVAMSETAAERMTLLLEAAVAERGVAAMSLTGGDTPDRLYQFLAEADR